VPPLTPCSPLKAKFATCFHAVFLLGLFYPEESVDCQRTTLHNHLYEKQKQKTELLLNETLRSHVVLPNHLTLTGTRVIVWEMFSEEAAEIKQQTHLFRKSYEFQDSYTKCTEYVRKFTLNIYFLTN
jgi:hypothetical protein